MAGKHILGATVVSDMIEGSSIVWNGEWQGRVYEDEGVILEVDPMRRLRATPFSSVSGLPDVPEKYYTVTAHLDRQRKGVRVTLIQDNNETEEARAHSEGGGKMMLGPRNAIREG